MFKNYRSILGKEQVKKLEETKFETVEEFLARGGTINKVQTTISTKRTRNNIDAQKLLDAAIGTPQEQEVIEFLLSQGVEISIN